MRLLPETIEALDAEGKTPADVRWVGSADGAYSVSWDDFAAVAADVEYRNLSGHAEVATDLVVVGDGWWLERAEYDGDEWWAYKACPTQQPDARGFDRVTGGMWPSLAEMGVPRD